MNRLPRSPRRSRPGLEALEARLVLTGDPALFAALKNAGFHWVDYAPSYDSLTDPYNANPSDAKITADLTSLFQQGFRGLVTYTLQGTYANIPRIAKSVGFQYVLAGVYNVTDQAEIAAASSPGVLPYADGFVVGNEGIQDGRYTYDQLSAAVAQVQQATHKPTTTSEPGGQYYTGSTYSTQLLGLGDWLFPNTDYFIWGGQPTTPQTMWNNVSYFYQFAIGANKTSGPVVAKEAFYPSDGGPLASQQNQYDWYKIAYDAAQAGQFAFVWGEAFDQPWKTTPNAYEPHMGLNGLNNANGSANPKQVLSLLGVHSSIRFARPTAAVAEGRSIAITLIRTDGRASAASVQVVVGAAGTATADDYLPLPNNGLVTFAAGASRTTIRLTAVADHVFDPGETVVLQLQSPTHTTLDAAMQTTVRIRNIRPRPARVWAAHRLR
ncbi:Calx-beta domain-containing protein [Paludisphaera rhizosphaerae]|uniref:Calx-beta domain-containing protein n=1 Tax=Paludisphaera rhizosphaerae TaxID=2711216 RepID=UPI0013EBDDAF|nr:hypothetical protein [Paludisphaera rhizosphaerae]